MKTPSIVTPQEWEAARQQLLVKEKELTHARDALAAERRRMPITRQAIAKHLALLAEAGLVTAEPGERRRVRYRLRSAPMQVAQQFLAALARDWDTRLDALKDHLDRHARGSA